jgi:hypothetical protein
MQSPVASTEAKGGVSTWFWGILFWPQGKFRPSSPESGRSDKREHLDWRTSSEVWDVSPNVQLHQCNGHAAVWQAHNAAFRVINSFGYGRCRVFFWNSAVSESRLLCNWRSVIHSFIQSFSQSVSQSVRLAVESLRDSWPYFGCSEDSCDFVMGHLPFKEDWSVM